MLQALSELKLAHYLQTTGQTGQQSPQHWLQRLVRPSVNTGANLVTQLSAPMPVFLAEFELASYFSQIHTSYHQSSSTKPKSTDNSATEIALEEVFKFEHFK